MIEQQPEFTLIIPCFNHAVYLPTCLDSIIKQSFREWEAIIVNDGSTDESGAIADDYAKRDNRIKVIHQVNKGLSAARNAALAVARGHWLQFMDADDFLLEGIYETVIPHLCKNCLLQIGYKYFDSNSGKFIQTVLPVENPEPIVRLLGGNVGPCHTIIIERNVALLCGPFDTNLKSAEDWDFWLRAAKLGATFKTIANPLVAYRYVQGSMSRDAFRMYEAIKIVAIRAPKKDLRIKIDSPSNKDYDFNPEPVIKKALLQCLGIALMQGKVEESVLLFVKETKNFGFTYAEEDFGIMCSYLSFRYWYSVRDLKQVFQEFYPYFVSFFSQVQESAFIPRKALKIVFQRHTKARRKAKWGVFGSLLNQFDDN